MADTKGMADTAREADNYWANVTRRASGWDTVLDWARVLDAEQENPPSNSADSVRHLFA